MLRDAAQHLLFELRAHARKFAQLLVAAELLQFVHRCDAEVLEQQCDALWSEPLNFQELERHGREFQQQLIAFVEAAALVDVLQDGGQAFSDARNVGDLPFRIRENSGDALGITFDRGSAVAITADAETVFARDLHQIGGLIEDSCEFAIFQAFSLLT